MKNQINIKNGKIYRTIMPEPEKKQNSFSDKK